MEAPRAGGYMAGHQLGRSPNSLPNIVSTPKLGSGWQPAGRAPQGGQAVPKP